MEGEFATLWAEVEQPLFSCVCKLRAEKPAPTEGLNPNAPSLWAPRDVVGKGKNLLLFTPKPSGRTRASHRLPRWQVLTFSSH